MSFLVPEKFRMLTGPMRSNSSFGNNGQFVVRSLKLKRSLLCQASDGLGWQHVSVSLHDRCPTWNEMSFIKDLFWGEDDQVVQYHPVKKDYINNMPFCLHLWAPVDEQIHCPPSILVGINHG